MNKTLIAMGLLALAAAGCATSQELERKSRYHHAQAQAAADLGDYEEAEEQMEKARKYHAKAVDKAMDEGGQVVVPLPEPAPAPTVPPQP